MEYNLENIFSTPISISDYDLRTLDVELTECLDSLNFSSNPDFDKCNTKTSGSVITSNVIEEYGLNHLKGCIMNSLKLYSHRVVGHSNFNFAIASSWFTKLNRSTIFRYIIINFLLFLEFIIIQYLRIVEIYTSDPSIK